MKKFCFSTSNYCSINAHLCEYFESCMHRKTATSIHAALCRTATSVWSVGFNFVNQDASRSNELREAKWKEKGILSLITIPASARKVTKLNGKERSLYFEKELQHMYMTFHF